MNTNVQKLINFYDQVSSLDEMWRLLRKLELSYASLYEANIILAVARWNQNEHK